MSLHLDEFLAWLASVDKHGRARSTRQPETGCLIWLGAVSCQVPKAQLPGASTRVVNVRRAALEAKLGRRLQRAEFATYRCGNLLCLNPDHLFVASRQEIQDRTAAAGTFTQAQHRAYIERIGANRLREIRELIAVGKPLTHIAREEGMKYVTVRRIAAGELGGEILRPRAASSIFNWHRRAA